MFHVLLFAVCAVIAHLRQIDHDIITRSRDQEIDFTIDVKNANQIMQQVQLQEDIMAIVSLLSTTEGNQGLSNLLKEPEEVDPNSSNASFESSKSQRVLDRIKRFSEIITFIKIF